MAGETKVVGGERSIFSNDVTEVISDTGVESDMETRSATKIVAEESEAGMKLFKDDGLCLDFTDLFGDNPLGHLLENKQALLNNFD